MTIAECKLSKIKFARGGSSFYAEFWLLFFWLLMFNFFILVSLLSKKSVKNSSLLYAFRWEHRTVMSAQELELRTLRFTAQQMNDRIFGLLGLVSDSWIKFTTGDMEIFLFSHLLLLETGIPIRGSRC